MIVPGEYDYVGSSDIGDIDTPNIPPLPFLGPPPGEISTIPPSKPVLVPSPPQTPVQVSPELPGTSENLDNSPPIESDIQPVGTVLIPDGKKEGISPTDSNSTNTTNGGMSTTTKVIIAVSCSVGGVLLVALSIVLVCYCSQKRSSRRKERDDIEGGRQTHDTTANVSQRAQDKIKLERGPVYQMNSFDPYLSERRQSEIPSYDFIVKQSVPQQEKIAGTLSLSEKARVCPGWASDNRQSKISSTAIGPMAAAATAASQAASYQSRRLDKVEDRSHEFDHHDKSMRNDSMNLSARNPTSNEKLEEFKHGTKAVSKSSLPPVYEIEFSSIELFEPVGRGSFGTIYKASWNQTPVAVKFLTSNDSTGDLIDGTDCRDVTGNKFLSVLDSEAEILASLRHPNIVQFIGVCSKPPCIISEFVEQGNLSDLIARSQVGTNGPSWGLYLKMLTDAATGMLYLHARSSPIIHCDLKSNNILVDLHYRTKICDFNMSRLLEECTGTASVSLQNPRWISPEVLDGEEYSKSSDVYAFGVIMWEVLTGRIPWLETNFAEIVSLVRDGARPQIPNFWDVQDGKGAELIAFEEYVQLMTECWAQNPYERPSFGDIIRELKDISLLACSQQTPDITQPDNTQSGTLTEIHDQALLSNISTRAITDSMPYRPNAT